MSNAAHWRAAENATRLEDLTFMANTGETTHGAARRLGISTDALEAWCRNNALHLWRQLQQNQRTPGVIRVGHLTTGALTR